MKLYAYCLAEPLEGVAVSQGISGTEVRWLPLDIFTGLVSELPVDVVPVTRENVLIHARVVHSVLDQTTPLPFRFATLATEQELQRYVSSRRAALAERFARVRGCVEMNVKIIWNRSSSETLSELAPSADLRGPGAAFLLGKRREILGSELLADEASALGLWLGNKVRDLVREEQVSVRPAEKLVFVAAHLVEREAVSAYKQTLGEARAERPDLYFLVSGPWAPYSFANIDLEFESHFGVS
jgi:hypothetical protein